MTPERWKRVEELFEAALGLPPGARSEYLRSACGDDDALLAEVESLLMAHEEAERFSETALVLPSGPHAAREPSPSGRLAAGSRLGPYEVRELIGAGGMGEVYRARDERLERDVAVKVLPAGEVADAERLRRFHQEARAAGVLSHPNILAVYDVGTEGPIPYVVSELLEGETLRERLSREGALPVGESVEVARQVAAGLAAAHAKGVVHRDLKPPNLFLTRHGHVKILDFGLAKRVTWPGGADHARSPTAPGVLLGTMGYMSPEQVRGEETGRATDVFSFGAVLFEMLTGRRAFQCRSAAETMAAILGARPDWSLLPADASPALRDILRRCLEGESARRYPDGGELLAAVETARSSPSAPAATPAPRGLREPERPGASLAVLPFRDLSPRPDAGHLGLSLADATITELARLGSLLVRPTSAVLRYRDSPLEPREAGRALAVDHVVEGTFQRSGKRLRVTVQLVSVEDGHPLWATKVDVSMADVFGMQDEVASRIAQALQLELSSAERTRRPRRPPSAGVYELYMKGKLALWRDGLADCIAAVDWFDKAREQDPSFALAWAGLAAAYVHLAFEFQPEGDWYVRAQAMCDRALVLEPDLPEARYVRARMLWSPPGGFDHEGAMRELFAALAVRPSLDDAHDRLGVVLWHVGLLEEGARAIERALALSPEHVAALGHRSACLLHQGAFAPALEVAEEAARRNQSNWHHYLAAQARLRLGDLEGAAALGAQMVAAGAEGVSHGYAVHALIAARRGESAAARRQVEQVAASRKAVGHYHHHQYDVACVHALLGDAEEALAWLGQVTANGYLCHPFFSLDPLLDGLRGRPEFESWLEDARRAGAGYARLHAALAGEARSH